MKPTLKDIARLASVSPGTVSNVLNNKKGVSQKIREKVLHFAMELGYIKENSVDRKSIRFVIYKKHGLVVSDTPFFSSLIEGIEMECREQGYDMLISHVNSGDTGYHEQINNINNELTSGLLILATEMYPEDLELFRSHVIPVVLLDSHFQCGFLDTVLMNNTDSSFNATEYLIDTGHTKIGYLHSSVYINNFHFRKQGYLEALEKHNMEADEKYLFCLEPTMDGSYRDMKALLEKGELSLPTGFFADNDIIAFGAMKALKEKGIHIPGDVSIVGFDDMPFCEMTSPRLTTIRVFKQEMGSIAVKRLLQKIREKDSPVLKIEVCTELIIRDSVKKR